MPAPAWENLDDFLDPDEFAVLAVVTFQDGSEARQVTGIFDDPYLNAELGEFDMDTSKPRLLAKESDFVGVGRGDVLTITERNARGIVTKTTTYDVMTGAQSTGDGMALLALTLVEP